MKKLIVLTTLVAMASACSSTATLPRPSATIGSKANKDALLGLSINNGIEVTVPLVKLGLTAPTAKAELTKPEETNVEVK